MQSKIIQAIKKGKTFLIVSHYHPDGDALGSTLALGLALKKLKKNVVMYNRDAVPFNLQFLPQVQQLTTELPKQKFDYAIMVDCAQPKRISTEFATAVAAGQFEKILCIDHHLLDQKAGDIDWIDPKAASTGCVIWNLLKKLKLHNSKEIANLIYCTLTVDTGSFRYSNTTPGVFKLAAELLERGADPWFVAMNLEETNPVQRYQLLALSLKSLQLLCDGQYASMDVSQVMLKAVGAHDGLSDDFANYPRSIAGVEVSALFREMDDGKIKVSLRSKLKVDVSRLAKQFGGGGHKHAAGCVMPMALEEAKRRIKNALATVL
ncbi:MAG: bifunctional oligoribonuclease/PAP phosphatase NrnA [Deltaproteobacteria bacterium]|nr:bifunctional oligoribonuclease/PAP phosphatase NrnA [Deltaproteobacteria bacterium]